MKKMISIMLATAIMFMAYLGKANATASEKAYWSLAFGPGMPSYVTDYDDTLTVYYYGGGHVAKATTLDGSYNRKVMITVNSPAYFSNGTTYREITVSGVVTPSWQIAGSYTDVTYLATAIGSSSCVSDGFICLNMSSLYNS